jgi:hypothetical protein
VKFSRTLKVAAAAALTLAGLTATLPAQAATTSHFNLTFQAFGKHKVHETVAAASKISGISYTAIIKKQIYKGKGIHCSNPVKLPLLKGAKGKYVYGVAELPCDNNVRTYSAYVKKYKPFTSTRIDTFTVSGPKATVAKLASASGVKVGSKWEAIMKAYSRNKVDILHAKITAISADGTRILNGPMYVWKDYSRTAQTKWLTFQVKDNVIQSISVNYIPAYMVG